jgi:hypothetical protein
MGAQVLLYFGRFNSLVLVVDGIRSNLPSCSTRATLPRICAASVRASILMMVLKHACYDAAAAAVESDEV